MSTHTITLAHVRKHFPEQFAELLQHEPALAPFVDSRDLSWTFEASDEQDSPEEHFGYDTEQENADSVAFVRKLASETVWGWCVVGVSCHYATPNGDLASDTEYLGGCSYESFDDFVKGGYAVDMMRTTFENLATSVRHATAAFAVAQ